MAECAAGRMARRLDLVAAEIVHDDDIAWPQRRCEGLLVITAVTTRSRRSRDYARTSHAGYLLQPTWQITIPVKTESSCDSKDLIPH